MAIPGECHAKGAGTRAWHHSPMRLIELTLPVSNVAVVASYFRDVLQLPVDCDSVSIGWSTIRLEDAAGGSVGGVHLAFNVPDNRFAAASAWLRARSPLQHDPEGKDYFALESSWQSQSVYFTGPDGLILELIGRRRLPASAHTGPFHGSEITCLSEVGLPSSDVDSLRMQLTERLGLQPLSTPSAAFAPMGDDEGLLILVDAQRPWFPEKKELPRGRGLDVLIGDVPAGTHVHDAKHGWRLRTA